MLQKSCNNNNPYSSWGWGSHHLHTKHSKWLHQNLHEVEEKLEKVLSEIEEDGDSFASRAEMYYKKRPQLVAFLHDFHHAYRSLAQRFHHLSTDLHSTSTTLATLLPPDHLPFLHHHYHNPLLASPPPVGTDTAARIDTLQKGILEMKAEKELVKVCYEHGLQKYTQIDTMIVDTEKEVSGLQKEFHALPDTTLRSFTDTLIGLQIERKQLYEEARVEFQNIKTMLTELDVHKNLEDEEEEEEMAEVGDSEKVLEMAEEMEILVSKVEKVETEVSVLRDMVREVQLESKEDIAVKLDTIMEMNKKIKEQKSILRVCFSDAHSTLNRLLNTSSNEQEKTTVHHLPSLSLDGDCGITATEFAETTEKIEDGEDEENRDNREDDLTRISSFSFSYRIENGENKQSDGYREEEGPNWKDLFTRGMENREKVLLDEYTSVLRNLKDVKSTLAEKEEELQEMKREKRRTEDDMKKLHISEGEDETEAVMGGGAAGERLRGRIDEVLERNLEFWLRFSSSFCQIQRFQREMEEVHEDEEAKKRLGEEMRAWLEEGAELREELRRKQRSLEEIEGEITMAVGEEDGEGRRFTAYDGSKLQGEVMNMKQENNKVGEELEAGIDHVSGLNQEVVRPMTVGVDQTLAPGSRKIPHHTWSRSRVPLKSFIFGGRFRRQRPSSSSTPAINPISIFGLHRKRAPPTPPPLPTTT